MSTPEITPEQLPDGHLRRLLQFITSRAESQDAVSPRLAAQVTPDTIEEGWLRTEMAKVDPDGILLYAEAILRYAQEDAIAAATAVGNLEGNERVEAIQRNLAQVDLLSERGQVVSVAEANRSFVHSLHRDQEFMKSGAPRFAFQESVSSLNRFATYIMPGEVILVSAMTSVGKSSFAQDLFDDNLYRGINGAYFHLEDSKKVMGYRFAGRRMAYEADEQGISTGISVRAMMSSILRQDQLDHIERVVADAEEWSKSGSRIHCPGWTMAQICRKWRSLALADDKFKFAVIDYFGKQKLSRESLRLLGGKANTLEEDFELAKTTAEQTETILVILQQEREDDGAVSNVFGTKTSRHKSQVCLSIERERDPLSKILSMYGEIKLTKVSNGELGSVPVTFLPDWMMFAEAQRIS